MRSAIEYMFWPGELAARAVEHVGASAVRFMQAVPKAFDSYRTGKELQDNHIENELQTLARDVHNKKNDPAVIKLDAQRIADLTWADYTQRVEKGEWRSPDYIAQVAKNLAGCGVPAAAMLEQFRVIESMPEPPAKIVLAPVPEQLTIS